MPQTFGPFTLSSTPAIVSGTALGISIDRSAQWVQVHNDTPLRLYFQFDGSQPTATDSMTGGYVGMAAPWAHPVLPVQRTAANGYERSLNAIRDFGGMLWIMPVDATHTLAQTGTVSQLVEIHIDVYLPGERPPESWAIPRQHDLTSQPRIVNIPMAIAHFYQGSWNGAGIANVATLLPNAAQLTAQLAPIYLYYAACIPANSSGDTSFTIQLQWQDGGGTNVGSPFIFTRGHVWCNATNNTATAFVFAPSWPFGAVGPMPGGAAKASIQLENLGGTPIFVSYTIAVSMDFRNITGISEIGQNPFNANSSPLF